MLSAASACVGLKSFIARVACGCASTDRSDCKDEYREHPRHGAGANEYTRLDAWTQKRVKERRCEVGKAGTVTKSGLNAVSQGMRTLAARRGSS
jgi:hypothetical protein